jgi:hypothetical protein
MGLSQRFAILDRWIFPAAVKQWISSIQSGQQGVSRLAVWARGQIFHWPPARESHGTAVFYPPLPARGSHVWPGPLVSRCGWVVGWSCVASAREKYLLAIGVVWVISCTPNPHLRWTHQSPLPAAPQCPASSDPIPLRCQHHSVAPPSPGGDARLHFPQLAAATMPSGIHPLP